ncbi:MAG: hypothetical protein RQ754_04365 [Desulfuromonadales bacterium]|jgi:hypothetical protein|nr:hypothetical protein [Desulfuromonadales bacterium]
MKTFLATLPMSLLAMPAFALDTAKTYNSGILVLLFVGFCALIIVAQLVPAVMALFGLTKKAAKGSRRSVATASGK